MRAQRFGQGQRFLVAQGRELPEAAQPQRRERTHRARGQVGVELAQQPARFVQLLADGGARERQHRRVGVGLETPHAGGGQVQVREHIAQPRRQQLHALQLATKQAHREVGAQRVLRGELRDAARFGFECIGHPTAQGRMHHAAPQVAQHVARMAEQRAAERGLVAPLDGGHLVQHLRVAAGGALAEDDERA